MLFTSIYFLLTFVIPNKYRTNIGNIILAIILDIKHTKNPVKAYVIPTLWVIKMLMVASRVTEYLQTHTGHHGASYQFFLLQLFDQQNGRPRAGGC